MTEAAVKKEIPTLAVYRRNPAHAYDRRSPTPRSQRGPLVGMFSKRWLAWEAVRGLGLEDNDVEYVEFKDRSHLDANCRMREYAAAMLQDQLSRTTTAGWATPMEYVERGGGRCCSACVHAYVFDDDYYDAPTKYHCRRGCTPPDPNVVNERYYSWWRQRHRVSSDDVCPNFSRRTPE